MMTTQDCLPTPPCMLCGGPHPYDTSVPSVQWNTVIRGANLPDYICATCILRAFVQAGVSFSATLWGETFNGAALDVEVGGRHSEALAEVEAENNRLRRELATARRAALEEAIRVVPSNWCDGLLTGPARVIPSDGKITPQHVERLIVAIAERIRALRDAAPPAPDDEGVRR
jgi:hypothetical protein